MGEADRGETDTCFYPRKPLPKFLAITKRRSL